MASASLRKMAETLAANGKVDPQVLQRALAEQQDTGKPLGGVLIDSGVISETDLTAALAHRMGLDFVELRDYPIDPLAATLVPEQLARRYCALPVGFDADGGLLVATCDPSNVLALDDLRTVTERSIRPVVATRVDVLAAIERYAKLGDSVDEVADTLHADDDNGELGGMRIIVEDAPVVKFVNALINQAVQQRASDIHIEPGEHRLRVRYRVDGVLHDVTTQSRRLLSAVVSRLKIMADLDIAERRVPQDGRISVRAAGKAIDLRMSTLPTVYGEKVVMRVLDKSSVLLELPDLSFSKHNYTRFEASFRKPYGMILVTGPTGSGKSTTLYATLNSINRPEVNIVTVEDPVEYRLAGINQVQINPRQGLTFAGALRSILRQDPDIVLVGEMRDHETAKIGLEAALTGHLVLATLHTNDAASAVTRLGEMGIDPFLIASALDCVLAQRLARRLCERCRESYEPTPETLASAGFAAPAPRVLYRPGASGCGRCAHTGYRGRLAVHEVLVVNEEIERLAVTQATSDQIGQVARADGMRTMRADGLEKVALGHTTLEELARVIV